MRSRRALAWLVSMGLGSACAGPLADPPVPPAPTLQTDAAVSVALLYESGSLAGLGLPAPREWIPMDLSGAPNGELWVVQRLRRSDRFDDLTECTAAAQTGAPNDCFALGGGTVAIREPRSAAPASEADGRANVVVDANAWHFMRRPSSIAFGAAEVRLEPDDPGAIDPSTGAPLLAETTVYTNTFGTCHEHRTGNFTDQAPFIGPTLWTADAGVYNGENGTEEWSNGSHLDMVHATSYCMGIAWEAATLYWTFNGELGTIDRYDFGAPHVPGHEYHDDAVVTRYELGDDALARLPDVPSNMVVGPGRLYVADTGNGRVLSFDRSASGTVTGTLHTHEFYTGEVISGIGVTEVASSALLAAEWGARVEPSGLALLDDETLVVASHGSGHITLMSTGGVVLRTIDTGLGEGIGGLTVMDGVVYFVQMRERRVYRVDVDTTTRAEP